MKLAIINNKINTGTLISLIVIEKKNIFEKASENGAKYLSICSSILVACALCAIAHNNAIVEKNRVSINSSSIVLFLPQNTADVPCPQKCVPE